MTMAMGEWKKALALSEEALAILRDQCVGVTWEVNAAQNLVIWALMYLGELGELSRRVPPLLANARSSGNLYIATELCTRSNYFWLAADDPDEGERVTLESIGRWSHKGFHRQHYSAMLARIQTALYRGNADAAWGLLDELDVILRRSSLTRIQVMRVESHYLRARSALAMAARHGAAAASSRSPVPEPGGSPASGCRGRTRSLCCSTRPSPPSKAGRRSPCDCLHDAVDRFDRADMQLYAAVARRRLGTLQDGAGGRELKRRAEEWMAGQGIKNPVAMTRMLAPGFPDAP